MIAAWSRRRSKSCSRDAAAQDAAIDLDAVENDV